MSVTANNQIFEYNGNTVSVDLSNVKFCPGPCNYSEDEPEPSMMNICGEKKYVYCFKDNFLSKIITLLLLMRKKEDIYELLVNESNR